MKSGNMTGRFGALRLVLATMLALLALPVAAASADSVSNPGSFDLSVTGGTVKIGDLDRNDILDFGAPTLTGTVDAAGAVNVPASGIEFPDAARITVEVSGNPADVDVSILAAGDATGTIDPDSGAFDLDLPVKVRFQGAGGSPDFGPECVVGSNADPVTFVLTSGDTAAANPISGTPYNQEDGTGEIVDNNFEVPAVSGCAKLGGVVPVDPAINSEAGLPAAAEASDINLEYEISTSPVGELKASYTADVTSGSAPLTVEFDAGASKSRIVNYHWDFGDGSAAVDTTDETVDHTYAGFGSFQPELTVTRANSDSDSLQGDPIVVAGAVTTFTQEAAEVSNETSPVFEFESDLTPATFECRFDGGTWESCTSPEQVGPLADGSYTFDVRATHAGVVGPEVSATPFTVDTYIPVTNPGAFDLAITGGTVQIGDLDPNDLLDFGAPTLTGTVDTAGTVDVPASGIEFPDAARITVPVGGNPVAVDVSILAAGDATGTIDPDAGTFNLDLPVKVRFQGAGGSPDFGPECVVGSNAEPVTFVLTSGDTAAANPISGTPYNQENGTGEIVDNNFEVPAVSGCDKIGGVIAVDPAINNDAGLPAAAEASLIKVEYEIITGPVGELEASYTADVTSGDAPLAVQFDAGASRSRVASYEWDFGDGSAPVTTVDATVGHVYTDSGTFQPKLTVSRANLETATYEGDEIVVIGAVASITREAAALSNEASPTFEFESDKTLSTFQCQVDGGSWTVCESPLTLNNLADGLHTFDVRAVRFGAKGPTASATPFEIDTAKPVVTIDSAPDALIGVGVTEGTVVFSADDPAVDFSCRYDRAAEDPFLPCVSPQELSWDAADGDHKFEVKAVDALGNISAVVATEWTVDITPPTTTLDSEPVDPNGFSDDPRAAFEFSSSEPGSNFICEFNDNGERPCESGVQAGTGDQGSQERLGDPVEGSNSFSVWAVDAAGNRDPLGASYSYEFIGEQPELSVLDGPSGSTTSKSATVIVQSNNQDVTEFECRDTEVGGPWAPCDPGVINPRLGKVELTGLSEGAHNLEIRGVNAIGAESKGANIATVTWNVDTIPPTVAIVSGPEQGSFTNSDSATFEFGSDQDDVTFSCRLDGASAWIECDSPTDFNGLSDGSHTLEVRATDAAGNVSNDPAERTWNVGQPGVTLTSTPDALSPTATAEFEFTGTAPFECRLDPTTANNENNTGWSACASPENYSGLSEGNHLFQVRGNGGFPASFSWIVAAVGPEVTFDQAPAAHTGLDQNSADIEFSATDPNGPVSFECRYFEDGVTPPPFDPCTSPQQVSWDENSDGTTMKFEVQAKSPAGVTGSVATTQWTIESVLPTVAIGPDVAGWDGTTATGDFDTADSDRPAPTTTVTNPQFRMTSSKGFAGSNFICQLNEGALTTPCGADGNPGEVMLALTGPDALGQSPLEGENTFYVWAIGAGGNVSDESASYSWTQDTTAPTLSFTSSNPVVTNSESLEVTFESDEDVKPVDGFKCRLDGAPADDDPMTWNNCDTMIDLRSGEWVGETLGKGQHSLDVKGIDVWNNRQVAGNGLRYSFTINREIPNPVITAQPDDPTADDSASFKFAAEPTAAGLAGYECQLDGGAWDSCTSPQNYSGLGDGPHVFNLKAIDRAGNVGTASATWTVDATMPVVTLSDDLPGAITNQDSVEFTLAVVPGDSTLECRLIEASETAGAVPWDACGATEAYTDLADGDYQFQARGINNLGTIGAAKSRSWTVDTVAPIVTFDSGPSGPTNNDSPSFEFSSDSSGNFICGLDPDSDGDSVPATACSSPVSYSDLADDGYTVGVAQTDAAGNVSAPATRQFTVDTVAPVTTITAGPDSSTEATTATFEFSSDEAGADFTCVLDNGSPGACASPMSYPTVAVGDHSFKVRATDAAGNVGVNATQSWTVTEPPPAECPDGQIGTPPDCVDPPTPGLLSQPVVAGPKQARVGRPLLIRVRTVNVGESTLSHGKVCLRTQKRVVRGPARRCQTITNLEAGAATVARFRIRSRANPRLRNRPLRVRAIVGADGAAPRTKGHVTILR